MATITVGNQLPILLIDFYRVLVGTCMRWESVTDPLDRLPKALDRKTLRVGNQLPILLIDFAYANYAIRFSWESVTDPLDRLQARQALSVPALGISYRSS